MGQEEFIEKMIELLDTEMKLELGTKLAEIEEWDSLSIVSFLAMINVSTGKNIKVEEALEAKTIRDLFEITKV